jgi:hypothetical protein
MLSSFRRRTKWLVAAGLAAALLFASSLRAWDHADATYVHADAPADLCSFYAWHDAEADTLTIVLTFDCERSPVDGARYDAEVVYAIHIDNTADPLEAAEPYDNDNDNQSDIDIYVRFGQNVAGEWGVQVENLPGATSEVFSGPVQTVLDGGNGTKAIAGLFDDPFFIQRTGLDTTLANLQDAESPIDLALEPLAAPSDRVAGTNAMAIALELSLTEALGGNPGSFLQLWATSHSPAAVMVE